MGKLFSCLLSFPQSLGSDAEFDVPVESLLDPFDVEFDVIFFSWLQISGRFAEIFDLHLFEFARAEGEIARRDLVAEGFTDLRDPKGQLASHRLLPVIKIDEDSLRGLGTKIGNALIVIDRADNSLEHRVEAPRLCQVRRAAVLAFAIDQMVGAAAFAAFATIY